MTDKNRSGWLSSVVGNISGFWSRSPTENDKSAHNSFTEVQSDSDFEGAERFEDAVSKFSPDKPTTSRNGVSAKPRSARYLSPTLLMNSVQSSRDTSSETRTSVSVSRKRTCEEFTDGESKGLNNGRLSRLDLSVDASFLNGNSPKRTRSSNRFLNETGPQLDRSMLDRSFDPRTPVPVFEFNSKSSFLQPRISRPPSATSSTLTSKTRAILQQLEKISTPVKEVKKMPFMCKSERWSTDVRTPVSRTLSNASPRSLSRAQIISNTMSASVPHKPYWRRPERQDNSIEASRKNEPSLSARSSILDSVQPLVTNNGKASEYIFAKDNSFTSRKKVEPVLKGVEGRVSKVVPKTFSAKALDLEVDTNESENNVRPVEESLFSAKGLAPKATAPAPGFLSGTNSTGNVQPIVPDVPAKVPSQESLGDDLFSFSLPKKRGPCALEEEDEEEEDEESSVGRSESEEEEDELEESEKDESKGQAFATKKGAENVAEKRTVPTPTAAFGQPSDKNEVPKADEGVTMKVQATAETKPFGIADKAAADKSSSFASKAQATVAVEPEKSASTEKASKPTSRIWTCGSCWVTNDSAITKCVCCGNPAPQPAPAPVLNASSTPAVPSSKPWSCPECFVPNKADVTKCVCCGYEKKALNAAPEKPLFNAASSNAPSMSQDSSTNVFGNRAFKPQILSTPSTGGVFGFGLKTSATSSDSETSVKPALSTSNSTASFGISTDAPAAPKFGLNASSSAPNFGLLFKKSTEAPSPLSTIPEEKPAAPVMPLFGNSALTKAPVAETSGDAKSGTSDGGSKGLFSFKGSMFGAAAGTSASTSEVPTFGTAKTTPSTGTAFPSVFGSIGSSLAKPSSSEAETSTAKPALSFGTKSLAFGAPVSDTAGSAAKPLAIPSSLPAAKEDSSSSVEMASPTSNGVSAVSQAPVNNAFSFSSAQPSFNFLSSSAAAPTSTTAGLFGSISSASNTSTGSTFSFGSAAVEPAKSFSDSAATTNPPSTLTKAFSTPAVPLPPSSFNFGAPAGNSPNLFGGISQAPTSTFQFGGTNAENPFSVPAGPFSGSNVQPNFFSSGTTSTTTARKLLKARRTRK